MRGLLNARPNVVALVLTGIAFAVLLSALNVVAGVASWSVSMVLSALALGVVTAGGGLVLTRLAGRHAISVGTYSLTTGFASGGLYFGMSLAAFQGGDMLGAGAAFIVGFLSALIGSIVTRVLTYRP